MEQKTKRKDKFYTYILKCQDGSYYTGYTNDLEKRIDLHNEGKGSKCLRGKRPVELVWSKKYKDSKKAMQKEREIKKLTHGQKAKLVKKAGF